MRSKTPSYLFKRYGSRRKWQADFRARIRVAERAARKALFGCSLTPAGEEIIGALRLLQEARKLTSVKNWSRYDREMENLK